MLSVTPPSVPDDGLGRMNARSCTASDTRNEYKIPGDDGIYAQGSDYESTTLTIGVNEMDLKDLAALTGASFSETPGELTESDLDQAPEVALSFSALMIGGGYRMYHYLNAKLTGALSARLAYSAEIDSNPPPGVETVDTPESVIGEARTLAGDRDTVLRADLLSQAFGHPLRRIEHAGRVVFLPD